MGTWGMGLFENETASDVRSDFCDYVADGFVTSGGIAVVDRPSETLRRS